jgi:hypothetical protein
VSTHRRWLRTLISTVHVLLIPTLVASMALFVFRSAIGG